MTCATCTTWFPPAAPPAAGAGAGVGPGAGPGPGAGAGAAKWKKLKAKVAERSAAAEWAASGSRAAGPQEVGILTYLVLSFLGLWLLLCLGVVLTLPVWIGAELVFWRFTKRLRRESQRPVPLQAPSPDRSVHFLEKTLAALQIQKKRHPHAVFEFLQGWFPDHSIFDMRESDWRNWLCAHFLFRDLRREVVDGNRYATEWHSARPGDESEAEAEAGADADAEGDDAEGGRRGFGRKKRGSKGRDKGKDGAGGAGGRRKPAADASDAFDRTLSVTAPKVGLGGQALGHGGPTVATPEEVERTALTRSQRELLDRLMAVLRPHLDELKAERGLPTELLPGFIGAKPLQPGFHLTGDYKTLHFSMFAYIGVECFVAAGNLLLRREGFKFHRQHPSTKLGLRYWHHPGDQGENPAPGQPGAAQGPAGAAPDPEQCPVLILPGIGIGHTMYLTLLKTVRAQLPNRTIFLIEVPQVNVRTPWNEGWGEAMNPREFQKAVRNLLLVHGFPPGTRPAVISHSYGNFLCRWLLKRNRYCNASGACMLDPLCFLTVAPEISMNVSSDEAANFDERIVKTLLRETGIAKAFNRYSFWPDVMMFDEDLRNLDASVKVAVAFSRKDIFLPAEKAFAYLYDSPLVPKSRVVVRLFPEGHGEFMLHPDQLRDVCRLIAFTVPGGALTPRPGAAAGGGARSFGESLRGASALEP